MLTPPTLFTWANWYLAQWDAHVQTDKSIPQITFKEPNKDSYNRYRQLMQVVDTLTLDARTLQYDQRATVASAIYAVLTVNCEGLSQRQVGEEFAANSQFLRKDSPFNRTFADFLATRVGFSLPELLGTIQYVAGFLDLEFNYDLPNGLESYSTEVEHE